MSQARRLTAAILTCLGCATPLSELPYCPELDYDTTPFTECQQTSEVQRYEDVLVTEILRRSQWEHAGRTPVRVTLTPERRVGRVCMGNPAAPPSWSERDRLAASLRDLRRVPPGPVCLAGRTMDLTSRLVERSVGLRLDEAHRMMRSCREIRSDEDCGQDALPVCAVDRDGNRRTRRDPCDACGRARIVGYIPGSC